MDDLPQRLGLSDEDWAQTPASVQVVVRALVRVIHDLQMQQQTHVTQFAVLQQEVAESSTSRSLPKNIDYGRASRIRLKGV
jgi:hypothetical protein